MESHLILIRNYDNRMVCACSNCNRYIASPSNGNGYDYCYHCGAKFDEHVSAKRIREFKKNARYDKGENNMEKTYPKYEVGEVVLYQNGDRFELGIVKRVCDNGDCFVWYHTGDTAARTSPCHLHKIANSYAFSITRLSCNKDGE